MKKWFLLKPLIFIVGLVACALLIMWIEALRPSDFGFYRDIFQKELVIERSGQYPLRQPSGMLTDSEREMAEIAWRYFVKNHQPATGFVNSVDDYASTTMWDMASHLWAIVCAYELELIDSTEFDYRLMKCLSSLEKIELYKGVMPNKVYHTQTMQMVDYTNNITTEGVGWSAMDVGRFFSVVNKVIIDYPQYTNAIRRVTGRWKMDEMIIDGTLYGIGFSTKDRRETRVQEGKLGYEEYAAKGLIMAGYDATDAMKYIDFIRFVDVYGIRIGVDTREVRYSPAYNYVLSEPYILDGIEYGWDVNSRELAHRIYRVQARRYQRTGIVTAVSEDHIDQAPYFVYNSVYANGRKWYCVAENGDPANEFKSLSTKAAFGWYVLYNDSYADLLLQNMEGLYDLEIGWYSGRYEADGTPNKSITANTNGIILQCLNYKVNGPLIKF